MIRQAPVSKGHRRRMACPDGERTGRLGRCGLTTVTHAYLQLVGGSLLPAVFTSDSFNPDGIKIRTSAQCQMAHLFLIDNRQQLTVSLRPSAESTPPKSRSIVCPCGQNVTPQKLTGLVTSPGSGL